MMKTRYRKYSPPKVFEGIVKYGIMILFILSALLPLYFVVITSLKTKIDYAGNKLGFPTHWVFSNFIEVIKSNLIFRWILNSLIITVITIALCIIISCFASYALARFRFKGRDFILNAIIPFMIIPPVVMIIPLLLVAVKLKITNTLIGPIAIYTGVLLPFSIYMLTKFFETISQEIIDSAVVDGCGDLRILFNIIMPLSKPALLTLIVVNSLYVWNELLIALIFLQSNTTRTLVVGLTLFKSRYSTNTTILMAGLLIGSIPMIAIYLFSQKYFVKGLVAGAVKG
ncbi:MAG: carbohydrate ABC transporter permease [Actinobacteria bacterium]|nr:carbohydrate ABC transporter permease [Actinomycetota bacterium]